jgi:hypothetical protein
MAGCWHWPGPNRKIDTYRCRGDSSVSRLVVAPVEPGVGDMQCVIRWIFRAKTMGFCFGVVAAGAVVFAVVLFFADSLKQFDGVGF